MYTDFILAALPWILIGLPIAIICALFAASKKNATQESNEDTTPKKESHSAIYLCIGMCLGIVFAEIMSWNIGLGICIGVLWASCFSRYQENKKNSSERK